MNILQMSITAAILILAIIVVRQLAIHRLPKKTFIILWSVVLLRLLIPFFINLPVPAQPSVEAINNISMISVAETDNAFNADVTYGTQPSTGIMPNTGTQSYIDILPYSGTQPYTNILPHSDTQSHTDTLPHSGSGPSTSIMPNTNSQPHTDFLSRINILEAITTFNAILPNIPENIAPSLPITAIWIFGMLTVASFIFITHFRCRKEYKASLPIDNPYISKWLCQQKGVRNIQARQSDRITAPLTYGILKPIILFPKTTDWQNTARLQYILTHELTHIRRFDILIKWLLVITLCIHWFNPLVWAMYILASRDIELSCDEAVVRAMGESTKSSYAAALIGLEERRSVFAPLCTSFSKNLIEERIVSIMKIRKRSLVSLILSACLVMALTIGALTVFASSASDERLFDPYDIPCESLYIEATPATPAELYAEAMLADDEDYTITDDADYSATNYDTSAINTPEDWYEWLAWFNALTPEQQAYVSLRPPQEYHELIRAYPGNENYRVQQSPYRVATTLEEVMAIIALQEPMGDVHPGHIEARNAMNAGILTAERYQVLVPGSIPVTHLHVPEIINFEALGIIVTEQNLYAALSILNETYWENQYSYLGNVITNMVTPFLIPQHTHRDIELHLSGLERLPTHFMDFMWEIYRAAVADGLLDGSGIYPDDHYLLREEAWRMFDVYGYHAGNWPTSERTHEAAQRLFGNH